MRSTFYRWVGYVALALASCLGFSLSAQADVRPDLISKLRYTVAASGSYGGQCAKLKAELAHMQSIDSERTGSSAKLTAESNGFRLADLTSTLTSGVASGKTGVGAGAAVS